MPDWKWKRILILGMTYPAYSSSYTENVCTGGVDAETKKLVRIHPVPLRYLDPDHQFRTFQWIEARVTRHPSDPRPESLRIDPSSIRLGESIPATEPMERRRWLDHSPHVVSSVRELKDRQKADGTSLGIVIPRSLGEPTLAQRSERERTEWEEKERQVLSQTNLFGEKPKPIDFPEMKFRVTWDCEPADCPGHTMNLSEWGLHQLARKYRDPSEREAKVLKAMEKRLHPNKLVYLFLGSFRGVQYNFGLMGAWSTKQDFQTVLDLDA